MEFPWIIRAQEKGQPLKDWLSSNPQTIQDRLRDNGAILLRGFPTLKPTEFEECVRVVFGEPMQYRDRVTRRREIEGHVYSSTDTPKHFEIPLHTESSFSLTWPRWICFLCVTPAKTQGRTPIANVRKVLERIPSSIKERFEESGVLYLRNFKVGPGMNWQTAFQVSTKEELETVCGQEDIEMEWCGENHLRTKQRRPAVVWDPSTGIPSWFNHAMALHVSSLPPSLREVLLRQLEDHNLPHQTYYGNGDRIDPEDMQLIRQAYLEEALLFSWAPGDLLILDNLVFAHGREPFQGAREILACLAGPTNWKDVQHSGVEGVCP